MTTQLARADDKKCLNPTEQRALSEYTLSCETCKLDLRSSEDRLNSCLERVCDTSWYQEPVVIGALGITAFLLGLIASSVGGK